MQIFCEVKALSGLQDPFTPPAALLPCRGNSWAAASAGPEHRPAFLSLKLKAAFCTFPRRLKGQQETQDSV